MSPKSVSEQDGYMGKLAPVMLVEESTTDVAAGGASVNPVSSEQL